MIGNSLIAQGIVLALGLAISFTYIKPTLAEIGERQDEILKTQTELKTINEVNERLKELTRAVDAIPQVDKEALIEYIPDQVDEVRVLKDLSQIASIVGVAVRSISYEGPELNQGDSGDTVAMPIPHNFSILVAGSYEKIKRYLTLLEQNKYPLEISTLNLSPVQGGYLELELAIVTYAHE
jgi:hypothetical protein